jgi:peptide chain release factor 2
MMQQEKVKQISELKGKHKLASWGNQIRSYVLHPYHLVKDLRTGFEVSDTKKVLDGDLDDFIKQYLKKYAAVV